MPLKKFLLELCGIEEDKTQWKNRSQPNGVHSSDRFSANALEKKGIWLTSIWQTCAFENCIVEFARYKCYYYY